MCFTTCSIFPASHGSFVSFISLNMETTSSDVSKMHGFYSKIQFLPLRAQILVSTSSRELLIFQNFIALEKPPCAVFCGELLDSTDRLWSGCSDGFFPGV